MISICIPVYNFNISPLLNQLMAQINLLTEPCEIICIDDASEEYYRAENKDAAKEIRYIQLPANVGRARIRNLFLHYAKYENLLFLDCDSLIIKPDFLATYIQYINQNKSSLVVCGGRIYSTEKPDKKHRLRWLYGTKRESQTAENRSKKPNAAFMTNNFIISKNVLLQTPFDERITNYGHEDTLFGYMLQKANIIVHHINNPVLNGHLETNKEYLIKTKQAVINLTHILAFVQYDKAFISSVSLLRFYYRTKPMKNLIKASFFVSRRILRSLLAKGFVSLALFDFYKLGIFAKNIKKQP